MSEPDFPENYDSIDDLKEEIYFYDSSGKLEYTNKRLSIDIKKYDISQVFPQVKIDELIGIINTAQGLPVSFETYRLINQKRKKKVKVNILPLKLKGKEYFTIYVTPLESIPEENNSIRLASWEWNIKDKIVDFIFEYPPELSFNAEMFEDMLLSNSFQEFNSKCDFVHHHDMPVLIDNISALLNSVKKKVDFQARMLVTGKNGYENIRIRASVAAYDESGNPFLIFGESFSHNIELDKNTLFEYARSEIRKLNSLKKNFLANINHELKTPLNSVMGLCQLGLNQKNFQKRSDCFKKIYDSSIFLLNQINDIILFSQLEDDIFETKEQVFSLKNLLKEISLHFEKAAMNKGLDFKYDFSAADPDLLSGDCENLKRVLAGLLINSLKFTRAGVIGLILEKALPENKIDVKKCGFNFIVYDTGPGIGRAEQKNLFNPFVQGENSLNKKYGGLGLGLALSKKIVKKMGGTLICESTLNRGAKFIVSLDFEMPKADFFEKDQSKSPRVLVVDDLDGILNLLKYHLKKMGCNVWTASDGLQALEMVENNDFDIVFMDIEMPVMNGIEAAKRIRVLADPIKSSVPLIAMTSYRYEAITEKIDSSGINGYLYKPFEPDNLRVILTKWVKNGEKNDFSLHFQPFNILTVGLENNKYIDFNQGISRFGGNRPLYLRSLKNFLQSLESLKADLIKIFSDSGRQGLKRKIHSIKGAAANLSLVQLFNEILEFEKILESDISDDHIISRINCFDDLINPLMDLRAEIAENLRNTKDIKTGHTVFFNTNSIGTKDYVVSEQEILCMIESLEKHIQSFQPKPCFKVLDRLVLGIKDEFALVLIKKIRKNVSEYRFDAVETDFAEFKKWFVRKVFKDEH